MLVHREFGVDLPDFDVACKEALKINFIYSEEREKTRWTKLKSPEAPCAVALRMSKVHPRIVNHMGTYIGNGHLIHTVKKQGASMVKVGHPIFNGRIEGFYAFR